MKSDKAGDVYSFAIHVIFRVDPNRVELDPSPFEC